MKKGIHPKLIKTLILLKDGASYTKKWVYFRNWLVVDSDLKTSISWKNPKFLKDNKRSLS